MRRFFYFLIFLVLISCNSYDIPPIDESKLTADYFEGIYLSDNMFFPNDTLILKPFTIADTATREKLLFHFKNDSVYLSNYAFGGWYGKWFCRFRKARANFGKGKLMLHGQYGMPFLWGCDNKDNETIWTKIEYQLIDSSDHFSTYLKVLDTSNCIRTTVLRYLQNTSRGGRNFTNEGGEKIRSDIQLR